MRFEPTATRRSLQDDRKTPAVAIAIQAPPPEIALHFQFDRLFSHQLRLKCLMLISEHQEQSHQTLPLLLGELKSPTFSTD